MCYPTNGANLAIREIKTTQNFPLLQYLFDTNINRTLLMVIYKYVNTQHLHYKLMPVNILVFFKKVTSKFWHR